MSDKRQKSTNMALAFLGPIGLFIALAALIMMTLSTTKDLNILFFILIGVGVTMGLIGAGNFLYYFIRQAEGKRVLTGAVVAGMLLVSLVIAVLVNFVANRHNTSWDLTSTKYYSISEKTVNILKNLNTPVRLLYIHYSKDESYTLVRKYLEAYRNENSEMVSIAFVDPDRDPEGRAQFEDLLVEEKGGRVVVSPGLKSGSEMIWDDKVQQDIPVEDMFEASMMGGRANSFNGEQKLTEAILKVTTKEKTVIGFADKNREIRYDGKDSTELGDLKVELEREAKEAESLDLNQPIDKRISVAVIAGPEIPYSPEALKNLDDYIYSGGSLLVLIPSVLRDGANDDFALAPWLRKFGVVVHPGVIQDPSEGMFQDNSVVMTSFGSHESVRSLSNGFVRTFFPKHLGKDDETAASYTVTDLISSSFSAKWFKNVETGENETGIYPIAKAVEGKFKDSADEFKIAVIGDARIASNDYLKSRGFNKDFMLNVFNWLAGQTTLEGISPKTPDEYHFVLKIGRASCRERV